NEPEGMTTTWGWTPNKIDISNVQRSVNWFADAIHGADPSAFVTNGAWTFQACSNVSGYSNRYSDSALVAQGGRSKGKLDFYEVHYYAYNGSAGISPFVHPASYWNLDKPIVIGEFWAQDTDGVTQNNLYTHLYDAGYAGAWAWQYANIDSGSQDHRWPSMQQG